MEVHIGDRASVRISTYEPVPSSQTVVSVAQVSGLTKRRVCASIASVTWCFARGSFRREMEPSQSREGTANEPSHALPCGIGANCRGFRLCARISWPYRELHRGADRSSRHGWIRTQ